MSKKYTMTGTVVEVGKEQTFNKFSKRTIVVCDDPESKYPNLLPFEAVGDTMKYLDKFKGGDKVKVDFFLNGRKWDNPKTGATQYFTTLRIASIFADGEGGEQEEEEHVVEEPQDDGDIDNMPF